MFTKVLKVFGEKTKKCHDNWSHIMGDIMLYPEGTKRIVKKDYWFPRKIKGIKVRGLCILEQIARIEHSCGWDDVAYNEWDNNKVLEDYPQLSLF